jgi:large subunit ribosomal protein L19
VRERRYVGPEEAVEAGLLHEVPEVPEEGADSDAAMPANGADAEADAAQPAEAEGTPPADGAEAEDASADGDTASAGEGDAEPASTDAR